MPKYVALIRGIGPGDPQKTNQKLCGALESLGFSHVQAVISSGNIIFESDETDIGKLEAIIEAGWLDLLGFSATTIVQSQSQLQAIIDADPFDGRQHSNQSYLLVTFCRQSCPFEFNVPYQPVGKTYQVVGYSAHVVYTVTDNTQVKTTDLMTWLEKQLGKDVTSRTPLTVERILKRMS